MSATDTLLTRNGERCDHLGGRALGISPGLRALVLTCGDHRVDPAHVLGVDLGEAVVLRNVGGRVTPEFIQSLAVLATAGAVEGLATGFELLVMHHTDCGTSRLGGPEYAALLAAYFGVSEADVAGRHVTDPVASVRADIALLRSHPLLPRSLIASGIVYDVDSGRAEVICPARALGEQ
jgi:carbonic anhydrase